MYILYNNYKYIYTKRLLKFVKYAMKKYKLTIIRNFISNSKCLSLNVISYINRELYQRILHIVIYVFTVEKKIEFDTPGTYCPFKFVRNYMKQRNLKPTKLIFNVNSDRGKTYRLHSQSVTLTHV